jgi:hypothetical protein
LVTVAFHILILPVVALPYKVGNSAMLYPLHAE